MNRSDTDLATPGKRQRATSRLAIIRKVLRTQSGALGATLVVTLGLIAVLGPIASEAGPTDVGMGPPMTGPSLENWLGTDQLGRDQAIRIVSAIPVGFAIPIASVSIALILGSLIGIVAGYGPRALDRPLMAVNDMLLSLPAILMALVIVGALGGGVRNTTFAIALIYLPRFARLARASTLGLRDQPFVEAARLNAVPTLAIIARHIVPNVLTPLVVMSALSLSTAALANASLSFLGLGVIPPTPDLGNMLATAMGYLSIAPWLVLAPAVALVLLILGFNLLGDGIRDALDPRLGNPAEPV